MWAISGEGMGTTDETRLAMSLGYVVLVLIVIIINMSCIGGVYNTILSTFVYV